MNVDLDASLDDPDFKQPLSKVPKVRQEDVANRSSVSNSSFNKSRLSLKTTRRKLTSLQGSPGSSMVDVSDVCVENDVNKSPVVPKIIKQDVEPILAGALQGLGNNLHRQPLTPMNSTQISEVVGEKMAIAKETVESNPPPEPKTKTPFAERVSAMKRPMKNPPVGVVRKMLQSRRPRRNVRKPVVAYRRSAQSDVTDMLRARLIESERRNRDLQDKLDLQEKENTNINILLEKLKETNHNLATKIKTDSVCHKCSRKRTVDRETQTEESSFSKSSSSESSSSKSSSSDCKNCAEYKDQKRTVIQENQLLHNWNKDIGQQRERYRRERDEARADLEPVSAELESLSEPKFSVLHIDVMGDRIVGKPRIQHGDMNETQNVCSGSKTPGSVCQHVGVQHIGRLSAAYRMSVA